MRKICIKILVVLTIILLYILKSNCYVLGESKEYDGFYYIENETGKITITGYSGVNKTITIPEEIEGKEVTEIGDEAMKNKSLKAVSLPEGVEKIGNHAFHGCRDMTTVSMKNGLLEIAEGAFEDCINLQYTDIPKTVKRIGSNAFSNCVSINNISIPEGIEYIGRSAFDNCSGVTPKVIFEDGVETIENGALRNCHGIKEVIMPNGIKNIGEFAFCNTYIEEIHIPQSVENIERYAFSQCIYLKNVTIPENVTSIKQYTFKECYNLQEVIILEGVQTIEKGAFQDCRKLKEITIPISVTSIDVTSLPKGIKIYGYEGSYAENFAKQNDIEFIKKYKVTFNDYDGKTLKEQEVCEGENATAPQDPIREGYTFIGWDTNFNNIYSNLEIMATYKENVILGDVNNDKKINTLDAVIILQYVAKKRQLTSIQIQAADINRDKKVNTLDAVKILQYVVKK